MLQVQGYLESSKTRLFVGVLDIKECGNETYLYRQDIKTLRKELPTTTQYIFLVR